MESKVAHLFSGAMSGVLMNPKTKTQLSFLFTLMPYTKTLAGKNDKIFDRKCFCLDGDGDFGA